MDDVTLHARRDMMRYDMMWYDVMNDVVWRGDVVKQEMLRLRDLK